MDTADNAGAKKNRPTDSGGCFLAGEHIAWKRTVPAETVLFIFLFFFFGVRVATTELLMVQTRFVPHSASIHCNNSLCCCGSASIDSFNGITPSGLRRSSGSSVLGTIFSLFHPHLPFGYIIEQKLNFCNIPDEIFTIYQATITEPLNCSVTNFLTSSD